MSDQLNIWALLVSGIVYSMLGSLWFSAIFGKTWGEEVKKHGIKIKTPNSQEMFTKVFITFLLNLVIAYGVSQFVYGLGVDTFGGAVGLGLTLGICFSCATMGISYLWESRSWKLSLIDMGYPVLGILASSIILTLWQ